MDAAEAIGALLALLSIIGGALLGVILGRRIRISESPALGIGARSARLWTWSIRFFLFLIVMVGVSFPVVLLLDALVGDR